MKRTAPQDTTSKRAHISEEEPVKVPGPKVDRMLSSRRTAKEDGRCEMTWGDRWMSLTGRCKTEWKKGDDYFVKTCKCRGEGNMVFDDDNQEIREVYDEDIDEGCENCGHGKEKLLKCCKKCAWEECSHCKILYCEDCEYAFDFDLHQDSIENCCFDCEHIETDKIAEKMERREKKERQRRKEKNVNIDRNKEGEK